MRTFVLPLLLLAACASDPRKDTPRDPEVKREAFKKVKPLSNAQVSEFYQIAGKSLNPALQDETLDRYSNPELSVLDAKADPLAQISIKCAKREFDAAFQIASANFSQYQKVAAYWNQVANCHLNQGSHRKALLFYNKALEVVPNYVPALNNIGVMYSRLGQEQKALVAFDRANRQSKFSKTPRYNLGKLYLTYGLADLALPIFQSLLGEAANDVDLLNATASAHFLKSDYQSALAYYQKIPRSEWSRPEIGLNLAYTLKEVGKKKEAVDVFEGVTESRNVNLKRYQSIIGKLVGANE